MGYIKRTTYAGEYQIVEKYYASRYGRKGIPRSANKAPTPKEMAAVNERRSVRKLWLLLLTNFRPGTKTTPGDLHLSLTYRRDQRLPLPESRKALEQFLRRARAVYRSQGRELRYITVTEWKGKNIHHHIICNHIDTAQLVPCWPRGMLRTTHLYDSDKEGERFRALAEYLIKETRGSFSRGAEHGSRRWNASTNLRQPREVREEIGAKRWTKTPRAQKGWKLVQESIQENESLTGWGPIQSYCMVLLPTTQQQK